MKNENSHETTPHSGSCVSPGISGSWFLPPVEEGEPTLKQDFFRERKKSRSFLKTRRGCSCAQKNTYMLCSMHTGVCSSLSFTCTSPMASQTLTVELYFFFPGKPYFPLLAQKLSFLSPQCFCSSLERGLV